MNRSTRSNVVSNCHTWRWSATAVPAAGITKELAPAGLDWISCLRAPQIAVLAVDTGPLRLSCSTTAI